VDGAPLPREHGGYFWAIKKHECVERKKLRKILTPKVGGNARTSVAAPAAFFMAIRNDCKKPIVLCIARNNTSRMARHWPITGKSVVECKNGISHFSLKNPPFSILKFFNLCTEYCITITRIFYHFFEMALIASILLDLKVIV